MNDCISRQKAIRWVKTECNPYGKPTLEFESGKKVIEHLEQMPSAQSEWIPCSERLPDANGMYLVTMMEKAKAEDLGFDLDEIEVRKMRYSCNVGWQIPRHIPKWINDVITDEVIAWMPLPKPFKEDRDD